MRSDIDSLWTRGSASLPCVQEGEGRSALRPWTRSSASLPGIHRCGSAIAGIGSCAQARVTRRNGNMCVTILCARDWLRTLMIGRTRAN